MRKLICVERRSREAQEPQEGTSSHLLPDLASSSGAHVCVRGFDFLANEVLGSTRGRGEEGVLPVLQQQQRHQCNHDSLPILSLIPGHIVQETGLPSSKTMRTTSLSSHASVTVALFPRSAQLACRSHLLPPCSRDLRRLHLPLLQGSDCVCVCVSARSSIIMSR